MTRKTYCGNLLWQSGLSLLAPWGDIGFCRLREYPDRAELTLVQYDYFSPKPLSADAAPNPAWQAIVRDNDGKRCTFVSTLLAGRKG